MKQIILCMLILPFISEVSSQDVPPSSITFIYDSSGSMWGQLQGKTKMEIASGLLCSNIKSLPENQKIGLVAYCHRQKKDCQDVEFLVDAENSDRSKVTSTLQSIQPLGMTPLDYSATLVINRLEEASTKATVILLTDGNESCDGNICDVVRAAKKEGIDFRLHIISFGLDASDTEPLRCAAEACEGQYHNAQDAAGLGIALNAATSETIDTPEGNVSVYALKNEKPVDIWVKAYDQNSKRATITVRTYGDTDVFSLLVMGFGVTYYRFRDRDRLQEENSQYNGPGTRTTSTRSANVV